jgi:hypothetical protein
LPVGTVIQAVGCFPVRIEVRAFEKDNLAVGGYTYKAHHKSTIQSSNNKTEGENKYMSPDCDELLMQAPQGTPPLFSTLSYLLQV